MPIGPVDMLPVHPQDLLSADAGEAPKSQVGKQGHALVHRCLNTGFHLLRRRHRGFLTLDFRFIDFDHWIASDELLFLMAPLEKPLYDSVVIVSGHRGFVDAAPVRDRLVSLAAFVALWELVSDSKARFIVNLLHLPERPVPSRRRRCISSNRRRPPVTSPAASSALPRASELQRYWLFRWDF